MSEFSSFAASAAVSGSAFPPIIGIDTLSLLINKSPATILMDRCRAPHKIPPACIPPGTKQPLWLTTDVLEWLASHRENKRGQGQAKQPAQTAFSASKTKNKKLTRPSKVEAAEAERLGLSVRELRAQGGLELGEGGGA